MITKVVHFGLLLDIKPLYLNNSPPPPTTKIKNKIKLRQDLFIQKLTLKHPPSVGMLEQRSYI